MSSIPIKAYFDRLNSLSQNWDEVFITDSLALSTSYQIRKYTGGVLIYHNTLYPRESKTLDLNNSNLRYKVSEVKRFSGESGRVPMGRCRGVNLIISDRE